MKGARFVLAMAWRETRAAPRRSVLLMAAVAVGVAAMVAINSFTDNLQDSVRQQARALLGADLALSSGTPFSGRAEKLAEELRKEAGTLESARVISFGAMVYAPRGVGSRLVQVTACGPGYPFYGTIRTDPPPAFSDLQSGGVVVDPSLLAALDTRVGDTLSLGEGHFTIRGTIVSVPGDLGVRALVGPRVFIGFDRVAETGLVIFGSRARHELFLKFAPGGPDPERVADRYRSRLQVERVNVRTVAEGQRTLSDALGRLGRYLGLTGLVALLLGGLGVASAVHAFLKGKLATIAVLRCLGATARQVFAVYLTQAAIMGLLGSLAGAALGTSVQLALPRALAGLVPTDVRFGVSLPALSSGIALGLWVAVAFSLLPLLAIRRIAPLAVLRRPYEAASPPPRDRARLLAVAAVVLSAVGAAIMQSGSLVGGLVFSAHLGVVLGLLFLAALGLTRGVRRFTPVTLPYVWRQGLANLHRPANQTRTVVLALGFGAFLLATLFVVQQNLLRDLSLSGAATDRPNLAFFDVQRDQRLGLQEMVATRGLPVFATIPIVPMRVLAVKGTPVSQLLAAPGTPEEIRARWALRREFMTTYRDRLTAAERVVAGRFWEPADGEKRPRETPVPVSIDVALVRELNVTVGDEIEWDVQGVPLLSRVTSVRDVEWVRFEPNFFVLFPEGPLAEAPQMFVILTRVDDAAERARLPREVAAAFPNVSSLDLSQVQQTVEALVGRIARSIRFMALFSLVAGAVVLVGAVAAGRRQRVREGVLLKTLGATRAQVLRILTAEYASLGVLSAVAALFLSSAAAWGLITFVFDARFTLPLGGLLGLSLAVVALTVGVGLLGSRQVFQQPPLEVLREE